MRSAVKVIGATLGGLVLVLVAIFIVGSASGGSLGIADDTSAGWTNKKMFEQTRSSMPAGTWMYWLGPSSSGFRLDSVQLEFAGDPGLHGAEVLYRSDANALVFVTTYVELGRPPADSDYVALFHHPIVGRVVTARNQLILLSTIAGHAPSPAQVQRLERDLRPVTATEIAALPEVWPPAP